MTTQVFAYIAHKEEKVDDTATEMLAAAKKIDPKAVVTAVVAGSGSELASVCQDLVKNYGTVWKIDNEALSYPNAELIRPLLVRILPAGCVVLLPNNSFGMDLGPGLSIKLNGAYVPDCIDFQGIEGGKLTVVRQEYSGQVYAKMECDLSRGAVVTVRPGAFASDEAGGANGHVEDKTPLALEGGLPQLKRRFLEVVEAEVGDVDITKSDVLVSCGRGIESEDNLELVFRLAEALGADVSCSRPLVDSKWMKKSRQVGTSGQTVKPKVYIALGISGAFQHLGGLKGNPFIVAINKNPKAPIFQVADVGVVGDMLEYIPELTEKINESKG